FEEFDRLHLCTLARLEALAARDLCGERFERTLQGDDLAQIAARVRVLGPQDAFRIDAVAIRGIGRKRADVTKAELILQPVAITQRLAEKFSGVEEKDRRRWINSGHHVQQDRRLCAERRDNRALAGEFALEREFQNAVRIATAGRVLKLRQLGDVQGIDGALIPAIECPRNNAARAIDDRDGGAHCSQPFSAIRLRERSETSRDGRPSARHAARVLPSSSTRTFHSGPKCASSHSRRRRAKPGARPPVEAVRTRSPRRTMAGTWKSHSSGLSSTLTRIPALRALSARVAESRECRPAMKRIWMPSRGVSCLIRTGDRPASKRSASRRRRPSPAPARPTLTVSELTTMGSKMRLRFGRFSRLYSRGTHETN